MLTFLLDSVYNSKAVSDNADQERDLSSAGRASALQAEGHRFEPYRPHLKNYGWVPEWPKGADCKSVASCFGGSNPPPSIDDFKSE